MRRRSLAFTLVEFMVVIAIIAIVAAILFPVYARARGKGYQASCMIHLRQLAVAWRSYRMDSGDAAPGRIIDVQGTYVAMPSVFQCSGDPDEWGCWGKWRRAEAARQGERLPDVVPYPISYVYDVAWANVATQPALDQRLEDDPDLGVLACPCHGKRQRRTEEFTAYSGLVLRARPDTSVIARHVSASSDRFAPTDYLYGER